MTKARKLTAEQQRQAWQALERLFADHPPRAALDQLGQEESCRLYEHGRELGKVVSKRQMGMVRSAVWRMRLVATQDLIRDYPQRRQQLLDGFLYAVWRELVMRRANGAKNGAKTTKSLGDQTRLAANQCMANVLRRWPDIPRHKRVSAVLDEWTANVGKFGREISRRQLSDVLKALGHL